MEKIAITTSSFGKYNSNPLELLRASGFEPTLNPYGRKLKKDEILEVCKDATGIIAGTELLDADVIGALRDLLVISRCGSGLDNVNLEAAKRIGIRVFNTPDAPSMAVAELTVGLLLNLLRKVCHMHISIKDGKWEKLMGNLLFDKKIGIIGFGRIGEKVAKLLVPFGCKIAYADSRVEDRRSGLKKMPITELLAWADIVSIHVSGGKGLIGDKELSLMKKGSWLVNTSRGEVVNEGALHHALKQGQVAGAALDVFEKEPYVGPLKELDNVILTPHIGSYAKEARVKMEIEAVENLLKGLQKG